MDTAETLSLNEVGSLGWLLRTRGRLTRAERWYLLRGMLPMLREGFRLRRLAKAGAPAPLSLEPPPTPMVLAARQLEAQYPRAGFRAFALKLIRPENQRFPEGRFALFQLIYWLVMR